MNRRVWTGVLFLVAVGAIALFLWEAQILSQSQANLEASWSTATQQAVLNNRQGTAGAREVAQAATQAANTQAQAVEAAQNQAATQQAEAARQASQAQARAVDDAQNQAATQQADLQTQMAATLADAQNQAATSQAAALNSMATDAANTENSALQELQNRAQMAQFQALFDAQNQAATSQAQLVATQTVLEIQLATAQAAAAQAAAAQAAAANQGSQNNAVTPVPPPATVAPTEAQLPETPVPTTQAAVGATPTLQGWQQFQTTGIIIWLPPSYVGGDLTRTTADVVAQLQALGSDFTGAANYVQTNGSNFALMAFDTSPSPARGLTRVSIITGDLGATLDIQTALSNFIGQLSGQGSVVEQGVVPLGSYQAGRALVEVVGSSGTKYRVLYYLLISGTQAWLINYTTLASEYATNLSTFEQITQTIVLTQ